MMMESLEDQLVLQLMNQPTLTSTDSKLCLLLKIMLKREQTLMIRGLGVSVLELKNLQKENPFVSSSMADIIKE
jgi:hypothetical protein